MKNMKNRNQVWGVFFICIAALLVLMQLGLSEHLGFWRILFTVVLGAILIKSITRLKYFGITFSIVLLLALYNNYIGIPESLMPTPDMPWRWGIPWFLLIIAGLLGYGLTILFPNRKNRVECDDIRIGYTFTGVKKYIKSQNLRKIVAEGTMGGMKLFLNEAMLSPEGAEIIVRNTMGGAELYIPRHWTVNNNISNVLGSVEERNKDFNAVGPVLTLGGSNTLGSVTVIYVG